MFQGAAWLQLSRAVDGDELALSAWVYIPEVPPNLCPPSSRSLKTVAATKRAGCKMTEGNDGWALFVHQWGTQNRELRLSWSTPDSACVELFAPILGLVPFGAWTQVGFTLSRSQDRAQLFLDHELVADTRAQLGALESRGQRIGWEEALVAGRGAAKGDHPPVGNLFLGGHAPEYDDPDGGSVHGLVGFLQDVRLFTVVPSDAPGLRALTEPDPKELLAAGTVPSSAFQALVRFAASDPGLELAPWVDQVSGQRLEVLSKGKVGTARRPETLPWERHPAHPMSPVA